MAALGSRLLFFSLTVLAVWWCCLSENSSSDWSISSKFTPSSSSRFYVLNDWQNTYSEEADVAALPAAKISDIMLKTMGILRDGANWPGVLMGNLFSRPLATALFLVDGISPESSLGELASKSFQVDQTGLTGCACADTAMMFRGDSVSQHLSDLFDQESLTNSVSANYMAAEAASANGAYTPKEQVDSVVDDIQNGDLSLSKYGLEAAADKLDLRNQEVARFVAELVLVKQAMEKLQELTSYVSDSTPDVFIFTISALKGVEQRYGAGSSEVGVATELVKQVIQESNKVFVDLYDGRVLVQALVLQWNKPEVDRAAPELDRAYSLLQPHLIQQDRDSFVSSLPHVALKEASLTDTSLCTSLRNLLRGTSLYAHCPQPATKEEAPPFETKSESRRRRAVVDTSVSEAASNTTYVIIGNIADSRSNIFSAMFLITLFVTVSLGLAVYAVSWALWNLDPGRDSVIYRQVSDPTVRMQ